MTTAKAIPPLALLVRREAIPAELRKRPQWVLWRYALRNGKWTKPPFNSGGSYASSTDPTTWATWEETVRAYDTGEFDGVGFVLTVRDPYVAVDLDHCRESSTGAIQLWAVEIMDSLPILWEISPSGTGLHAILRGKMPPGGHKKGNIEIYDRERYITVTGHVLSD